MAARGRVDLSASMMCANLSELGAELARLEEAGIDSFHFDIMDGHFVPNLALTPDVVSALRPLTARPFIAHLMVEKSTRLSEADRGRRRRRVCFSHRGMRLPAAADP